MFIRGYGIKKDTNSKKNTALNKMKGNKYNEFDCTRYQINLVTGPEIIIVILFIDIIYNELSDTSVEKIYKYIYIITLVILSFTFILENTLTYIWRHETYRN